MKINYMWSAKVRNKTMIFCILKFFNNIFELFCAFLIMGNCFSIFKKPCKDYSNEHSIVDDKLSSENEMESEVISDDDEETSEGLNGWDQYHAWVRSNLLNKWSAQAEERNRLGHPPLDEINSEMLTEMLMFGLASK